MRKGKGKNVVVGTLILVMIIGLLGFQSIFGGFGGGGDDGGRERVPCVNPVLPVPPEYHWHPQLRIIANGAAVPIPANIGIELAGCHRVLHTHDATGVIHIELNVYQEFTLGDFMSVWKKPFSKAQILDYQADETHEVVMTVGGQPSLDYENLVLKDQQEIVIEYKEK